MQEAERGDHWLGLNTSFGGKKKVGAGTIFEDWPWFLGELIGPKGKTGGDKWF